MPNDLILLVVYLQSTLLPSLCKFGLSFALISIISLTMIWFVGMFFTGFDYRVTLAHCFICAVKFMALF